MRKNRRNTVASTAFCCALVACAFPLQASDKHNGFDVSDALVPPDEIHWGGVPRDGIPAIHHPKFIAAGEASMVRGRDRVLGVFRNGIAKAYPIRILDRHEVVNDKFDGESIVVTWCPLCNSGMAFMVQFGAQDLKFGVSGLLYNSDVLLYDGRSGSLWSQILGMAISGPLKGYSIPAIPVANTTWRHWRELHPDTVVLSTETGYRFRYRDPAYGEYRRSSQLLFPVANKSKAYRRKDLVLGVTIAGKQKAYPFSELRKYGQSSFRDMLGHSELTIEWYEDEKYARVLNTNGEEVPAVTVYWFAWYAFHPGTEIFEGVSSARLP